MIEVVPETGIRLAGRMGGVASSAIRDLLALTARPEIVSLAGGLPAESALPVDWIREVTDRLLTREGARALQYSTTDGDPGLRELIADLEGAAGTPRPQADAVVVTTGSQQALDLLGKVLVEPGDVVAVDDPAYLGGLQAFRLAGARIAGIAQDADGMRTDDLEERLRGGLRPVVVYTTPTFHNPAGTTMPADRRRHLAALADTFGFLVIEDDPYRRLAFPGQPAPPAPVAAHGDRVIRLGSFSKTLGPGLRIGWLVAPPAVREAVVRAKQATDLHTSTFTQLVARDAAADTERFAAHVRETAATYELRAATLTDGLRAAFGDRMTVVVPAGGMFLWMRFTDGTATDALLPVAIEHGVAYVPGSAFSAGADLTTSARTCFATSPPDRLTEGVERLRRAHAATRR